MNQKLTYSFPKLDFGYLGWLLTLCLVFQFPFLVGQTAVEVSQVSLTVSNLEESIRFFEEVLPFKTIQRSTLKNPAFNQLLGLKDSNVQIKQALLELGKEKIELLEFVDIQNRAIPTDSRSNDLWFQHLAIVVNNMKKAYKVLQNNRVQHVSTAPQTLPAYIKAAAGIQAFYFRDPDGHNLEIIYFPTGKGNPRWQEPNPETFIGIDHTAIGISNTTLSRNFYMALLGLDLAGQSENYGSEQEHLNQVFGARLLISGLKAQSGLGIEFLEYIAPPGGRNYPEDSQVTDLWHWHTSLEVNNLKEIYDNLTRSGAAFISPGIMDLANTELPYNQAFMVRDPDGHALLIYEK